MAALAVLVHVEKTWWRLRVPGARLMVVRATLGGVVVGSNRVCQICGRLVPCVSSPLAVAGRV